MSEAEGLPTFTEYSDGLPIIARPKLGKNSSIQQTISSNKMSFD